MTKNGTTCRWLRGKGRSRRYVTVDVDSHCLRLVHCTRGGANGSRLRGFVHVEIPVELDSKDPVALGEFLRDVLKQQKLTGLPLIMNVPRGQAVLKPLLLPPGTQPDEVAAMVQFQVQGEIPFSPEETVLDFTIEGPATAAEDDETAEPGVNVLAAAVRCSTVEYYQQLAEAAGQPLHRLGLRPYANARCLQACEELTDDSRITALVHITTDETEIDILEGQSLAFSRSAVVNIPATEGLVAMLETNPQQTAEAVVSEVVRSISGYSAQAGGRLVDRILLAGSVGIEYAVAGALGEQLDRPCRILNPAEALHLSNVEQSAGYISGIGLAYGSRGQVSEPFDFLHPKKPVVKRDPRKARQTTLTLAGVLVLIVFMAGGWWYLDEKETELRRLGRLASQEKKKSEALKKLKKRYDVLEQWQDDRVDWLGHWANLSSLLPPAHEAYISGIKTSRDTMSFTLYMHETQEDGQVMAELSKALQEAGYQLATGKYGTGDSKFAYEQQAEVTLTVTPGKSVTLVKPSQNLQRPADDNTNLSLLEAIRQMNERLRGRPGRNSSRKRPSSRGRW